jgi:hypothetical protein
MSATVEDIRAALNHLMKVCGLRGESGTEQLFYVLSEAMDNIEPGMIQDDAGLCLDVTWPLAGAIHEVLLNNGGTS